MSITEEIGQAQTPLARAWTPDDSTFGARLAMIRQRMGWGNIAKAAKECGVPTDSWRNWEVDNREPHRMTTIAMSIATRTGCDYRWLVHGPDRGDLLPRLDSNQKPTGNFPETGRLIIRSGDPDRPHRPGRPVRETRPIAGLARRPRPLPVG